MLMRLFGGVARERGVGQLVGAQLLARMPNGMLSVAALMHAEAQLHEYSRAGLTVAAFTLGAAVVGPFTGRWLARFGMRRLLGVFMLADTACMVAFGFLTGPLWAFLLLAFGTGVFQPPVQPAVRTVYPKLVSAGRLQDLFSLDAAAQEIIWIIGPVLVTFSATALSTAIALWITAVLGAVGGFWLLLTPVMGQVSVAASTHRMGAVLRKWPVMIALLCSTLLIAAFGANETTMIAAFAGEGAVPGLLLALLSVASVVSGTLSSRLRMRRWSMGVRTGIVGAGVLLCGLAPHNPWWVALGAVIAGIGSAPSLAVTFANVSSSLRFADTAEAFAWLSTGQLVGSGIGSALAGWAIDEWGPGWAFALGGALGLLGGAIALAGARFLPDLDQHSGPVTDTSTIPVIRLRH